MFDNIEIGINDFYGRPIKCGDTVIVELIIYGQTIESTFEGKIIYNKFNCMFMIDNLLDEHSYEQCMIINSRSMNIKIKK